jgi:DNA polymerase
MIWNIFKPVGNNFVSKILLVGEAWGQREERFAHAFVGPSGAELARMLAQVDLAPMPPQHPSELDMIRYWKQTKVSHDIEIANVFNLHPPDNDIEELFAPAKEGMTSLPPLKPGKYLRPEYLPHLEKLWDLVAQESPNLVIALGNTPCWALLGESKITSLRGTVKISPKLGIKVLPTYHPAYVLRQWKDRPIVLSDLEKAKTEAEYGHIKRIERFVTIEPTLRELAEWSLRPAQFYAVDIETITVKYQSMISMVGLARTPDDAIVIPFIDERNEGWSYWPCAEEEIWAWKFLDDMLRDDVPKVFQNGVFDLSHLLRAGLRPTRCDHDTMLLHHSLYPEMLKGLGFLGSIYSQEIAWKSMRKKGDNLKRDE